MSVSFSYFVAFGFVLSKLVVNDDIKGQVMMIKSRFSQTSAHFLFGKSNERKDRETEKKIASSAFKSSERMRGATYPRHLSAIN